MSEALTFKRFREINSARAGVWHSGKSWSLSDWAVAMAGEAGEACNAVKKLNRERDSIAGNDESHEELMANLAEELADTLTYLFLLADSADIDIVSAVVGKFNRVSVKHGLPHRIEQEST